MHHLHPFDRLHNSWCTFQIISLVIDLMTMVVQRFCSLRQFKIKTPKFKIKYGEKPNNPQPTPFNVTMTCFPHVVINLGWHRSARPSDQRIDDFMNFFLSGLFLTIDNVMKWGTKTFSFDWDTYLIFEDLTE